MSRFDDFSMKFPIESGIGKLSTIILKIWKKWHKNFIFEIAFALIEKINFHEKKIHTITYNWFDKRFSFTQTRDSNINTRVFRPRACSMPIFLLKLIRWNDKF